MSEQEDRATNRVFALAGILQSAHLVNSAARTGMVAMDDMEASLKTLFTFDADYTLQVYGGLSGLKLGIRTGIDLFVGLNLTAQGDVVRYLLSLIRLERNADPALLRELAAELNRIQENYRLDREASGVTGPGCLSDLADLYEKTLGTIEPRIQVLGSEQFLHSPATINRIRALLLAGFRSTVLWHQLGGRRRHLVLDRTKICNTLKDSQMMMNSH